VRHPGAARNLAQCEALGPGFGDERESGIEEDPAEVAVMIGRLSFTVPS
jgi:hypothetical protein